MRRRVRFIGQESQTRARELDTLIGYSESVFAERQSEQLSLFGDAEVALPLPKLPVVDDWTEPERLEREFEALGFYLSGHPLDEFGPQLKRARVETYLNLCERAEGRKAAARLAGSVSKVQMRVSEKNKTRYAFVELSDTSGVYEVMVFSEELEQSSGFLKVGARVLLDVETAAENGSTRLKVNRIRPLKLEEAKGPNGLKIYFNSDAAPASVRALMDREKKSGRGGERGFLVFCPIADDLPSETMIEVPGEYFHRAQDPASHRKLGGHRARRHGLSSHAIACRGSSTRLSQALPKLPECLPFIAPWASCPF